MNNRFKKWTSVDRTNGTTTGNLYIYYHLNGCNEVATKLNKDLICSHVVKMVHHKINKLIKKQNKISLLDGHIFSKITVIQTVAA